MEPNMDKATAFHLTVQYMVFLRNALRQQDPTVIPKLHEVCGDAVNQAVQMVLWRFRPIASSPTEAKRVRLFYSGGGGGGGGDLANFQGGGGNLQGDETPSYYLTGGIDYYIYFGEWLI